LRSGSWVQTVAAGNDLRTMSSEDCQMMAVVEGGSYPPLNAKRIDIKRKKLE